MTTTKNIYFTKNHEWVLLLEDNTARMGITQYATEQLGDIVFVEVPELSSETAMEEEIATVESVKSASEIYAPLSGTVTSVNEELEDSPELVNEAPYEAGWLAEIHYTDTDEISQLMNQSAYDAYVKELKEEEGQ
ncbi:glycine cleavage system protein GcvH [Desemzia incerta]|uniref:Glycine cleavage system H protein n=1 Tax=Desemzia incerta TaxID=82801 RepID=A0A1I5W6V2_9LACT|nr:MULTISPECIES: glycine cleavage system protein GcvH [Desemzia]MCI3029213.1 glycine cleavage system protein GcvH [Desemzia sp. C1]WHZ31215.1 glycine cleavage system protein GcvH [Desemzia incerta]SFQ15347.1 glycine cleavage system H protein [Desemzia incerta]